MNRRLRWQSTSLACGRTAHAWSWAGVLLLLLALTASALAWQAAPGYRPRPAGRGWRIAEFHSNLTVMPDGAMLVNEDITAAFTGEYHWISRSIPVEYPGPRGTNYTLFLKIIGVTDENKQPLKYETNIRGAYRYLKIYLDNAFNTDKTVRITYTVQNGVRFFDNHDELYWNVTGNDWPVPIDNASAIRRLSRLRLRFAAGAGFHRRLRLRRARRQSRSQRQPGHVRKQPSAAHARRLDADVYIPKGMLTRARP